MTMSRTAWLLQLSTTWLDSATIWSSQGERSSSPLIPFSAVMAMYSSGSNRFSSRRGARVSKIVVCLCVNNARPVFNPRQLYLEMISFPGIIYILDTIHYWPSTHVCNRLHSERIRPHDPGAHWKVNAESWVLLDP